jgi:hypothetical protein
MQTVMKWRQYRSLSVFCSLMLTPAAALADPVIGGIHLDRGPVGSLAIISGSDFGEAQGRSFVLFGERMIPVLAWTASAISIYVNPMAFDRTPMALDTAYPVQVVTITGAADRKNSNTVNYTLTSEAPPIFETEDGEESDPPVFESFQKGEFCDGELVHFQGLNLGDTRGGSAVTLRVPFRNAEGTLFFQDYVVPVVARTDTQVQFRLFVPPGAELGTYTATVQGESSETAAGSFTVVACE